MKRLEAIYRQLPSWGQDLAVTLQGALYWRQRYGGTFVEERQFLESAEKASSLQIELLANARLKRMLSFAASRVPAYQQRIPKRAVQQLRAGDWRALAEIPITEKFEVKEDPSRFFDGGKVDPSWIRWSTSGTTGSPLSIYYTVESVQKQYAFVERYREQAGVSRFQRRGQFTGKLVVNGDRPERCWRYDWANRSLLLSTVHLTRETIPGYLRALTRFRPKYLTGYPSAIALLARHAIQSGSSLRLEAVLTSAETLTGQQRALIQEGFGAKVYDQYGQTEMQSFWSECRYGRMHAHPLFGVTEILRPNGDPCLAGEVGDVVLTGLLNHAMPLVRYRVGDQAVWSEESRCPCGSSFPIVARIEGRRDDYLYSEERGWVGRMDPVLKGVEGILECQFIQTTPSSLEIVFVPDERFREADRLILEGNLRARLGGAMEFHFTPTARIPRGPNGKFRSVVSRLPRHFQPAMEVEEVA